MEIQTQIIVAAQPWQISPCSNGCFFWVCFAWLVAGGVPGSILLSQIVKRCGRCCWKNGPQVGSTGLQKGFSLILGGQRSHRCFTMLINHVKIGINHVNQHSIVTCINHVKIGIFLKTALDPDLFYHDFEVAELQSCNFWRIITIITWTVPPSHRPWSISG
jgi:hypothetical protein